ncbi:MAG: WhiB family transcriptional regulator [Pseudonocardiaceae bacterium]|nr:WhiB family transcriptional regulator [Pseudonocardiaceae bacterium]
MVLDAPTAVCAEVDPELWFPEKGGSTRDPKRLCRSCPLMAACLEWALDHPSESRHGVWGGMSEGERYALRRRRRTLAPAVTGADDDELAEVA